MNLDEAQKKQVSSWIGQGLKLSDIQKRLETEMGLRLTYLDVRLLVDDLKLVPKDIERPVAAEKDLIKAVPGAQAKKPAEKPGISKPPKEAPVPPGRVSVRVDTVARPGAIVSGKVDFSDGGSAEWVLDQYGRLGLIPQKQGYKPSQADLQQFQAQLQEELQKQGF